jgi:hypothetical protein
MTLLGPAPPGLGLAGDGSELIEHHDGGPVLLTT